VIDAAQSGIFVAAEEHRRTAVRAERADETDGARAVAIGNEIFAEQAHANRRAVRVRQFRGERERIPIPAKRSTHRRAGIGAGDALVILAAQHTLVVSIPGGVFLEDGCGERGKCRKQ
jgi:hypothetical protein